MKWFLLIILRGEKRKNKMNFKNYGLMQEKLQDVIVMS